MNNKEIANSYLNGLENTLNEILEQNKPLSIKQRTLIEEHFLYCISITKKDAGTEELTKARIELLVFLANIKKVCRKTKFINAIENILEVIKKELDRRENV